MYGQGNSSNQYPLVGFGITENEYFSNDSANSYSQGDFEEEEMETYYSGHFDSNSNAVARNVAGWTETDNSYPYHYYVQRSHFFGSHGAYYQPRVSTVANNSMIGWPRYQGYLPPSGHGAPLIPRSHVAHGQMRLSHYPPHSQHGLANHSDSHDLRLQYPMFYEGPPPGLRIQKISDVQTVPNDCKLYIFHIPNEWYNIDMYCHFRKYGEPISVRIEVKDGLPRGYGFVSYDNPDSAKAAIEGLNKKYFNGKFLKVKYYERKEGSCEEQRSKVDRTSTTNGGRGAVVKRVVVQGMKKSSSLHNDTAITSCSP